MLADIAGDTGKTVSQVALNWLLSRPSVCNVVIGARNAEQLQQNLGAVGWSLTGEARKYNTANGAFDGITPRVNFDPASGTWGAFELVARYSDCTELQVAQATVDLARESAHHPSDDPRIQRRHAHVGYYLIDKGFPKLAERTNFHPSAVVRARAVIRAHADDFYISGIQLITLGFLAALILPLSRYSLVDCLIAAIFLVLPVMQCATDLANNSVTSIFDPAPLPKLDFSEGVPAGCTTLVAVPTLLMDEKQVRSLAND